MSKIGALRLINLNYNNNSIRISDEVFHLNGESTLLSLRNGGGKSVLVQMLTAPFVHKRYRDAKDRPFESYFTTNKPTFILVEWQLDQGAGYVLTGMMVRKSQQISDENMQAREELEIVSFISEYKERCMQDIFHLPVVEKTKKEMVLKNFSTCLQMFETYKKDRSMRFFCYDMNNAAQSRQYFDKLQEYQISYKEWETIIKKVNLKESGLSDLFSDCRDEKGLVEKWFLDAVESKLNRDKNRMKEFQSIIEKYVAQYKDNQSKIQRRDVIRQFKAEAEKIMEKADKYQLADKEVMNRQNAIAAFRKRLDDLQQEAVGYRNEAQRETEHIKEKIAHIYYEKISKEIYEIKKEERYHSSNMEMLSVERGVIEEQEAEITRHLELLECAKQQEQVDENNLEYQRAKESLAVSKQQEEDLEPEKNRLGLRLCRFYEAECQDIRAKVQENRVKTAEHEQELRNKKEEIISLQEKFVYEKEQIAERQTRIRTYDDKEIQFNRRCQEALSRNILGEYEPGALEIQSREYEKQTEQKKRERTAYGKKLESAGERARALKRSLEDKRQKLLEWRHKLSAAQEKKEHYDNELAERLTILRYLDMGERDAFDLEKIRLVSGRKLSELERNRHELEKEENEQQQKYVQLTQGKILELPGEFQMMLEELGIHYVYGMEWLRKNGNTQKQNNRLVKNHPFLPYALILSRQELTKLSAYVELKRKEGAGDFYTSFPIPLMVREELASGTQELGECVVDLKSVQFYVLFNENLLDEEKLKQIVAEKERLLDKLRGSISQKKKEYEEYFRRQERVENQELSKERYEENAVILAEADKTAKELELAVKEMSEEELRLEKEVREMQGQVLECSKLLERLEQKIVDFAELCNAYEEYLKQRHELERHKSEASRLTRQQELCAGQLESLENQLKTLGNAAQDLLYRLEKADGKRQLYREYTQEDKASEAEKDLAAEDISDIGALEARYMAIIRKFSAGRQELEERAAMTAKRVEKAREELEHLRQKYKLQEAAWTGILYNRREEQNQEIQLEDCRKKRKIKERLWNDEDKAIALLRQQLVQQKQQMEEACGKSEPLPETEITTADFDGRIHELSYEQKEKEKKEKAWNDKINAYDSNLTSLAEYADFEIVESVEWEEDFAAMQRRELDEWKGRFIRDYRVSTDDKRQCYDALMRLLNQIVRMEMFAEDFYRKPLEALIELAEDARQVISQLNTILQSYDSLMEKLQVDISMVEQERDKIMELFSDYLRQVHEDLGKIDQNSTITIRERPIKMLKILLPDWEENESVYQVRLMDFIDTVTQRGIAIFEQNENAQEYFGTRVTTKNLYDTVIGIGNVQIRLFKIEEQREYAITWAEVSKNSGGEGFLSAFAILSSLLYYMRRDDSDIFADRNEGKVLVMDNPFAQTNASHLLKPLLEMAKKTNTQLICLSGLGGESIYNRFDNIYVLNLIAASLRSGMQYLRADHARGAEPDTVIVSQIEVVEQQELLF